MTQIMIQIMIKDDIEDESDTQLFQDNNNDYEDIVSDTKLSEDWRK